MWVKIPIKIFGGWKVKGRAWLYTIVRCQLLHLVKWDGNSVGGFKHHVSPAYYIR